jgi:hypothetical protein
MTPEDAWDFLKAKLLVIFDGEDVRIAIEDLNKLIFTVEDDQQLRLEEVPRILWGHVIQPKPLQGLPAPSLCSGRPCKGLG